MADLAEVGDALVAVIVSATASIANTHVFQGLQTTLPANTVQIAVYPQPGDVVTSVLAGDGDWQEQSNDGTQGVSVRELRRQTKTFQITIWASTSAIRNQVAKVIDSVLAVPTVLTLPDSSQGLLRYASSTQIDAQQAQGIYERDLFYAVNYAITQTENDYAIKEIDTNTTRVADASDANSVALGSKITVARKATSVTTTITP